MSASSASVRAPVLKTASAAPILNKPILAAAVLLPLAAEIDGDVNLDLSVLGLPFQTRLPLRSSSTRLYLEGNLGYLTGEAVIPD